MKMGKAVDKRIPVGLLEKPCIVGIVFPILSKSELSAKRKLREILRYLSLGRTIEATASLTSVSKPERIFN
jgi:hypothetical protein